MAQVLSLSKLSKIIPILKKDSKTIGLITGCFDILHSGHVSLFRFAKKHVDILIVAVENDEAIKLYNKGPNRPINSLKDRLLLLSELKSIDYIFPIKTIIKTPIDNYKLYKSITKTLKPDCLISNLYSDKYLEEKRNRAKFFNIKLLIQKNKIHTSSTKILNRI